MTKTVQACPRCDSTNLYHRIYKTPEWLCLTCNYEFEEPHLRPSRRVGQRADLQPGDDADYDWDWDG